ncbi:hypothetical protein TWF696_006692 [Orbilia brochopaga]|uniref:Extracellular serine-rich protein n=1 Tax=Orbilia brochopaga TaxID=3140254 RepID=A0AAV9USY7_9PEZI
MVAFSPIAFITAIAAVASTALAAPTRTSNPLTPRQWTGPVGATHSIVVGRGGLRFDPDNVQAEIGDVIEWHFTPRNHSIVQSNFGNPCVPTAGAFFSGFVPTMSGQNGQVYQIRIVDKNPIWYYCSQTVGDHCQMGMAGVINQDYNTNEFTLARYRQKAALLLGVQQSVSPPYPQAGLLQGALIPNPNPLSGFKN